MQHQRDRPPFPGKSVQPPFEVLPHLGSALQVCDQHTWPFVKFNTTEQTNEEVFMLYIGY